MLRWASFWWRVYLYLAVLTLRHVSLASLSAWGDNQAGANNKLPSMGDDAIAKTRGVASFSNPAPWRWVGVISRGLGVHQGQDG